MKHHIFKLAFTSLLVNLVGCATEGSLPKEVDAALNSPSQVILYSLEPWEDRVESPDALHSFKVLGKTELRGQSAKDAAQEIRTAVASAQKNLVALCFDPRHALRIMYKMHTYDLLICYSCLSMEIYKDDKPFEGVKVGGSPARLNTILTENHVHLSQTGRPESVQQ